MNFQPFHDEKTGKWLKLALFCVLTGFCLLGIYFAVHHVKQSSDADKTEQAIRNNDSQIPIAARAKSDRTVVTVDEEKQKVDVYKINLRNNHKIKAGGTYIDGKPYLSIGYQAGRIEGIVHTDGTGVRGGTVMYTIKEW